MNPYGNKPNQGGMSSGNPPNMNPYGNPYNQSSMNKQQNTSGNQNAQGNPNNQRQNSNQRQNQRHQNPQNNFGGPPNSNNFNRQMNPNNNQGQNTSNNPNNFNRQQSNPSQGGPQNPNNFNRQMNPNNQGQNTQNNPNNLNRQQSNPSQNRGGFNKNPRQGNIPNKNQPNFDPNLNQQQPQNNFNKHQGRKQRQQSQDGFNQNPMQNQRNFNQAQSQDGFNQNPGQNNRNFNKTQSQDNFYQNPMQSGKNFNGQPSQNFQDRANQNPQDKFIKKPSQNFPMVATNDNNTQNYQSNFPKQTSQYSKNNNNEQGPANFIKRSFQNHNDPLQPFAKNNSDPLQAYVANPYSDQSRNRTHQRNNSGNNAHQQNTNPYAKNDNQHFSNRTQQESNPAQGNPYAKNQGFVNERPQAPAKAFSRQQSSTKLNEFSGQDPSQNKFRGNSNFKNKEFDKKQSNPYDKKPYQQPPPPISRNPNTFTSAYGAIETQNSRDQNPLKTNPSKSFSQNKLQQQNSNRSNKYNSKSNEKNRKKSLPQKKAIYATNKTHSNKDFKQKASKDNFQYKSPKNKHQSKDQNEDQDKHRRGLPNYKEVYGEEEQSYYSDEDYYEGSDGYYYEKGYSEYGSQDDYYDDRSYENSKGHGSYSRGSYYDDEGYSDEGDKGRKPRKQSNKGKKTNDFPQQGSKKIDLRDVLTKNKNKSTGKKDKVIQEQPKKTLKSKNPVQNPTKKGTLEDMSHGLDQFMAVKTMGKKLDKKPIASSEFDKKNESSNGNYPISKKASRMITRDDTLRSNAKKGPIEPKSKNTLTEQRKELEKIKARIKAGKNAKETKNKFDFKKTKIIKRRIKKLKPLSEVNMLSVVHIDNQLKELLERNFLQGDIAKSYKDYVYKRRYRIKNEPYLMGLLSKHEKHESQRAQLWSMCAGDEIKQREMEGMVDCFELRKQHNEILNVQKPGFENIIYEKMNSEYAVKRYMRSAADTTQNNPSGIRPPFVLKCTINYLTGILDDDKNQVSKFRAPDGKNRSGWSEIQSFLRDRLRGINTDITVLSSYLEDTMACKCAIESLELTARFHIMSIEEGSTDVKFDGHSNLVLLSATLETQETCYIQTRVFMKGIYKNVQDKWLAQSTVKRIESSEDFAYISPSEPEFIAYQLVLQYFKNPDKFIDFETKFSYYVEKIPELLETPQIKLLLEQINALKTRNYIKYFEMISNPGKTDYFMSTLLSYHGFINLIRLKAVEIMSNSFRSLSFASAIDNLEELGELEYYEIDSETQKWVKVDDLCETLGFFGKYDACKKFLNIICKKKDLPDKYAVIDEEEYFDIHMEDKTLEKCLKSQEKLPKEKIEVLNNRKYTDDKKKDQIDRCVLVKRNDRLSKKFDKNNFEYIVNVHTNVRIFKKILEI